jgi:hypothetical protein
VWRCRLAAGRSRWRCGSARGRGDPRPASRGAGGGQRAPPAGARRAVSLSHVTEIRVTQQGQHRPRSASLFWLFIPLSSLECRPRRRERTLRIGVAPCGVWRPRPRHRRATGPILLTVHSAQHGTRTDSPGNGPHRNKRSRTRAHVVHACRPACSVLRSMRGGGEQQRQLEKTSSCVGALEDERHRIGALLRVGGESSHDLRRARTEQAHVPPHVHR